MLQVIHRLRESASEGRARRRIALSLKDAPCTIAYERANGLAWSIDKASLYNVYAVGALLEATLTAVGDMDSISMKTAQGIAQSVVDKCTPVISNVPNVSIDKIVSGCQRTLNFLSHWMRNIPTDNATRIKLVFSTDVDDLSSTVTMLAKHLSRYRSVIDNESFTTVSDARVLLSSTPCLKDISDTALASQAIVRNAIDSLFYEISTRVSVLQVVSRLSGINESRIMCIGEGSSALDYAFLKNHVEHSIETMAFILRTLSQHSNDFDTVSYSLK